MASTSSAWLRVIIKQGLKVVQRSKIVQCHWENTFGELFLKSSPKYEDARVLKVEISHTEQL